MTRSERLLAIMQSMLGRRAMVTAAALAEEFGVSERTIYRDIAVLAGRGAVIEGAAGAGYAISGGHFLPPLMFGLDEADALVLGLRYAMMRGDERLSNAARSALAKIGNVVPVDMEPRFRLNGLVVGPPSGAANDPKGLIRQAIIRERKLVLAYTDAQGQGSSRIVWPVMLGFFDDCEMLAAWCETRDAFRHFRIDRMTDCREHQQRLPRPHRRLLADYRLLEPGIDG